MKHTGSEKMDAAMPQNQTWQYSMDSSSNNESRPPLELSRSGGVTIKLIRQTMWNHAWALLGLVAFTLYVLACRPAFSPDGSKLLLPTFGGPHEASRVLLLNWQKQQWRTLLHLGENIMDEEYPVTALWSPDGKQMIAAWAADDETITICVTPVESPGVTRLFHLDQIPDAMSHLVIPPPVIGDWLYIGGREITALNWRTGESRSIPLPDHLVSGADTNETQILLSPQPNGLYCLLAKSNGFNIGQVELNPLKIKPVLTLDETNEGVYFLAVSPNNTQIALAIGEAKAQELRIYQDQLLQKTYHFSSPERPVLLGNMAYSPNGQTLYVAAFEASETKTSDFVVYELPSNGDPMRTIRLFPVQEGDEAVTLLYQFALSPDGMTLAAFGGIHTNTNTTPEKNALFLVDLKRADRRIKKIAVPKLPIN